MLGGERVRRIDGSNGKGGDCQWRGKETKGTREGSICLVRPGEKGRNKQVGIMGNTRTERAGGGCP